MIKYLIYSKNIPFILYIEDDCAIDKFNIFRIYSYELTNIVHCGKLCVDLLLQLDISLDTEFIKNLNNDSTKECVVFMLNPENSNKLIAYLKIEGEMIEKK